MVYCGAHAFRAPPRSIDASDCDRCAWLRSKRPRRSKGSPSCRGLTVSFRQRCAGHFSGSSGCCVPFPQIVGGTAVHTVDFLRHASDVQRARRKRPLATDATRGLRRLWRIGGPNIPCQVASPQSLTPFLRARSAYRANGSCRNRLWTSELCLRKSTAALPAGSGTQFPDEPFLLSSIGHGGEGTGLGAGRPSCGPCVWNTARRPAAMSK